MEGRGGGKEYMYVEGEGIRIEGKRRGGKVSECRKTMERKEEHVYGRKGRLMHIRGKWRGM